MKPKTLPRLPIHITLFTRESCNLCSIARDSLARAWQQRPFEFEEIDVMEERHKRWKVYEFDVPVIHVARTVGGHGGGVAEEVRKLMHRFTPEEVVGVWEAVKGMEVEGSSGGQKSS